MAMTWADGVAYSREKAMRRPLTVGMSDKLRIPRLFFANLIRQDSRFGDSAVVIQFIMRNILKFLTVIFLVGAVTAGAYARTPRLSAKEREKIEKENMKEAKKLAKQLKKEGWKIEQTGLPENVIADFLNAKELKGLETLEETAEYSSSRSKARSYIKTKAANAYAQEQSQVFKGRLNGMESGDEEDAEEKFVKQWEGRYAMEVAGILKVGYSQYKKNDDGTVDMEIHFLIDPEAAHNAKLSAAKYAIEVQKLNQEWADKISEALSDIDIDNL